MFVPGEDRLTAVDAYNGTILWEREIAGSRRVIVFRDSSQLVAGDGVTYLAAASKCFALNAKTGETARTFEFPKEASQGKHEWGYLASVGEVLLGSGVKTGTIRREQSRQLSSHETHQSFQPLVGSDFLFALDSGTGKPRWTYKAETGLIVNATLTIGGGCVYFVRSDNAATLRLPLARTPLSELVGKGSTLVALDIKTGKIVLSRPATFLNPIRHIVFGQFSQDRLILVGTRDSGTDKKKDRVVYDIHVLDAVTGEVKWSKSQTQSDPSAAITANTIIIRPSWAERCSANRRLTIC